MSVAFVIFLVALLVLVVAWVWLKSTEPSIARRAPDRHPHQENPDYLPGHVGQGGV